MDSHRERLLKLVSERRKDLGLDKQTDLVKASGVSRSTVGRFERGEPVDETSLRKISRGIRWTPDSAQDVLAGGEPTIVEAAQHDLESRYRREPVPQGMSVGLVEDMIYEAFIAAAPDTPLREIDKAKNAAFEVLRRNGIEVALRHPEASQGTETRS